MKVVRRPDVQIEVAQRVMKSFFDDGRGTFASFLECWERSSGRTIYSGASPRPLLYGNLQTAYSTFIGFSGPTKPPISNRGCLFALYLLHSTQPPPSSPIHISPSELKPLALFASSPEETEARAILAHLVRTRALAFSATPTQINSPPDLVVSPAVVDERGVATGVFTTSREDAEERRPVDSADLAEAFDSYASLMRKITL